MPALPFCHVSLKASRPPPAGYPIHPKSLGDHLRKRRIDLKLLQSDVAKQVGVDTTSVWNWESNRSRPSLQSWPRIVEFLGYEPEANSATSISARLLVFRRAHGLSQTRLAKRLGIDPGTLGRWERGTSHPSARWLTRVSRLLVPRL